MERGEGGHGEEEDPDRRGRKTLIGSLVNKYVYFVAQGKSMKHAAFNEAWIKQGDEK
jgi:hypothetical protein